MTNIDPTNLKNYAAELFDKLDAKDGKIDGKVQNSVWNEFAENEQTQGNNVKNFIERENGIKAIVRYMKAQCEKLGVDLENYVKPVFRNVVDGIKGEPTTDPNPPANDPNPPKADPNPPAKTVQIPDYAQRKELAGQKIINTESGETLTYDSDGFVIEVRDRNGNLIQEIFYHDEGKFSDFFEYEYDENGNCTREIHRNDTGECGGYENYEYDSNGNRIKAIHCYEDGVVSDYWTYEYDELGNITKEIIHEEDGSVRQYNNYEYDKKGVRQIIRNYDGTVATYYDYNKDNLPVPTKERHKDEIDKKGK